MIKKIKNQKSKIKRFLKIFFLFANFSLKTTFQTRWGIVFFVIGKLLRFFFLLGFLFLVFSKTKSLYGYSFNETAIFFMTFNLIDNAAQFLFREVYRFRPLIISGGFDLVLVKPYHPFLKVLIGGVDYMDLFTLVLYLLITLHFALKLSSISLTNILLYLLLLINGVVIATAFHIIVLALGILMTTVDHTIMIYRDLTSIGRFPLDIYREPIRFIFTFIFPIALMMNLPAQVLIGKFQWQLIAVAVVFAFGLLGFSVLLWRNAVKHYQSWGG